MISLLLIFLFLFNGAAVVIDVVTIGVIHFLVCFVDLFPVGMTPYKEEDDCKYRYADNERNNECKHCKDLKTLKIIDCRISRRQNVLT